MGRTGHGQEHAILQLTDRYDLSSLNFGWRRVESMIFFNEPNEEAQRVGCIDH